MKRVLIYSTRSLFSSGIKTLLDAEPELTVIAWETDAEEVIKRIHEMQPDVILVMVKGPSDAIMSDEQRFVRAGGKTKVIELNLEDSNVCIYSSEQIAIKEIQDLVRVIQ
ncbi:hypothetical protein G4Y79_14640 [Phototrophicus methaneseepsis]|uniref:Uncharacterized protein n=1 Tax=Phototrophicus methaneseepsis TaxID=2710758 RepID=A0A7S8E5U7_9CHLR|nr:hypothetical protein [Phototrophicus methaneseepsis]QPC80943.1 hypothetical protein G4Y79_14640 [Phototrophicus methaneseepsis]